MRCVLILWLISSGLEVNTSVSDCSYNSIKPWIADARAWATRSGLDPYEVGYLCWSPQQWAEQR
jgi:hypothetical protein